MKPKKVTARRAEKHLFLFSLIIAKQDRIHKAFAGQTAKEKNIAACIFFLAFCGLRISEALGLEWHDIDFETGLFSIVRTGNYRKKETATRNIYAHAVQQANAQAIDEVAKLLNVSCGI